MNKTLLYFTMIFILGFIHSCMNQTKEKQQQTEIEVSKNSEVQLNHGNRWSANPETTKGIESMISMMEDFKKLDDIEAYKELSKQLTAEFSSIFRRCTMTGKAHIQLHNFLLPIKDLLGSLDSPDLIECKKIYLELKSILKNYTTYFK